jgi:hypothetical protein
MPTKDEADELQIPVTMPALEIACVGTSEKDEQPLDITVYVIPGDRVEHVVVLERAEDVVRPWPEAPDTAARNRSRSGAEHHGCTGSEPRPDPGRQQR